MSPRFYSLTCFSLSSDCGWNEVVCVPLDQNENYERCQLGLLPLLLEMFYAEPQVEVKVKLLRHYLLKDD